MEYVDQLHLHLVWQLHSLRQKTTVESGKDCSEHHQDFSIYPGCCAQTTSQQSIVSIICDSTH